jgi:subtilisin family serine protease
MRRGVVAGLAFVVLLAAAAAAAGTGGMATREVQSAIQPGEFVPGEVIVRFKPGLALNNQRTILGAEAATLDERLRLRGAAVVKLAPGQAVSTAVAAFEQQPEVLYAQPNYVYHADQTPSDPIFNILWGLQNTGQAVESMSGTADADIDAPEAWDLTTGSDAVKVAVVDTGVEYDHPDLAGNIVELGRDFYSNDLDPRDENGHGTHVAGTIGAQGGNALGVTGVNWDVGLMPIRVLGPTGSGTTASITNGFIYAAQRGARVVNASLGGGSYDPSLASAISGATGTLFVVAAGNGGGDRVGDDNDASGRAVYPCNYDASNLVCVAATDLNDTLAVFSNYGTTSVDLAAPGVKIGSTWVGGTYVYSQGTSMASPHVAGVAALVAALKPAATVAEIRAALLGSVDVLTPLSGRVASGGRLNAYKALLAVAPPAPPAVVPPSPSPPATPVPRRTVKKAVKKVTICYRKRTIRIAKTKLAKYKKRGAKVGVCKKPKKRLR